jgi:hypothetical protein
MADDNITEGCSETHLYIGFLYVYFNMSKFIKYIFYNVGQALGDDDIESGIVQSAVSVSSRDFRIAVSKGAKSNYLYFM